MGCGLHLDEAVPCLSFNGALQHQRARGCLNRIKQTEATQLAKSFPVVFLAETF